MKTLRIVIALTALALSACSRNASEASTGSSLIGRPTGPSCPPGQVAQSTMQWQ